MRDDGERGGALEGERLERRGGSGTQRRRQRVPATARESGGDGGSGSGWGRVGKRIRLGLSLMRGSRGFM